MVDLSHETGSRNEFVWCPFLPSAQVGNLRDLPVKTDNYGAERRRLSRELFGKLYEIFQMHSVKGACSGSRNNVPMTSTIVK